MDELINAARMPENAIIDDMGTLALFLGGSHDSWTGEFLRLIAKSDHAHRAKLRLAYPVHVRAFEVWQLRAPITVAELTKLLP
jgi:hypothetical protein